MAGECFEEAWRLVIKARDTTWDGRPKDAEWHYQQRKLNNDIDAVVDDSMKEHERKEVKTNENPTGNRTIQRVIDRIRGNPSPKPPAKRKPATLQSETLRRLHEKVKKD